jgi:hypothetical protein
MWNTIRELKHISKHLLKNNFSSTYDEEFTEIVSICSVESEGKPTPNVVLFSRGSPGSRARLHNQLWGPGFLPLGKAPYDMQLIFQTFYDFYLLHNIRTHKLKMLCVLLLTWNKHIFNPAFTTLLLASFYENSKLLGQFNNKSMKNLM